MDPTTIANPSNNAAPRPEVPANANHPTPVAVAGQSNPMDTANHTPLSERDTSLGRNDMDRAKEAHRPRKPTYDEMSDDSDDSDDDDDDEAGEQDAVDWQTRLKSKRAKTLEKLKNKRNPENEWTVKRAKEYLAKLPEDEAREVTALCEDSEEELIAACRRMHRREERENQKYQKRNADISIKHINWMKEKGLIDEDSHEQAVRQYAAVVLDPKNHHVLKFTDSMYKMGAEQERKVAELQAQVDEYKGKLGQMEQQFRGYEKVVDNFGKIAPDLRNHVNANMPSIASSLVDNIVKSTASRGRGSKKRKETASPPESCAQEAKRQAGSPEQGMSVVYPYSNNAPMTMVSLEALNNARKAAGVVQPTYSAYRDV